MAGPCGQAASGPPWLPCTAPSPLYPQLTPVRTIGPRPAPTSNTMSLKVPLRCSCSCDRLESQSPFAIPASRAPLVLLRFASLSVSIDQRGSVTRAALFPRCVLLCCFEFATDCHVPSRRCSLLNRPPVSMRTWRQARLAMVASSPVHLSLHPGSIGLPDLLFAQAARRLYGRRLRAHVSSDGRAVAIVAHAPHRGQLASDE